MKKLVIMLLIAIMVVSIVVGCTNSEEASITEIDITTIKDEQFKKQLQGWENKNGAYLLEFQNDKGQNKDGSVYLFLNSFNVQQGSNASYFESVTVDYKDNTMNIYFVEKQTDKTENIKNKALYKIPKGETTDTVLIFKNGEKTNFESLSVIGK